MELRQLTSFVKVAELGSMTQAAEALHIVQPALSRQIKLLEREVGLELFVRGARGMRLTQAGEVLYQHARRILNGVEVADQALSRLKGLTAGRVALGVVPSLTFGLLPPVLVRFRQRYPGIQIQVFEQRSSVLPEDVTAGRCDLAVLALPEDLPGLFAEPLYREPVVLVLPPDHRLAGRAQVDLTALIEENWLLPAPGNSLRRAVEAACRQVGFGPRLAVQLDGLGPLKQLVQAGLGIAALPPATVEPEARLGLVSLAAPSPRIPDRQIGLIHRRAEPLSPAAEALRGIIAEVASGFRLRLPRPD